MTKWIKISIIIFAVLVLAAGGYLIYKKYHLSSRYQPMPERNYLNAPAGTSTPSQGNSAKNPAGKSPSGLISDYKLYKNSDFGFEIQYPQTWTVNEESIVNVRGENTKAFYFKPPADSPNSDLRFAILPRDGLSYGLPNNGTTTNAVIGGSPGSQTQYTLPDGRRLWLVYPQYWLHNWSQDIGRIDILSSAVDPANDTIIFEKMLSSFKLSR